MRKRRKMASNNNNSGTNHRNTRERILRTRDLMAVWRLIEARRTAERIPENQWGFVGLSSHFENAETGWIWDLLDGLQEASNIEEEKNIPIREYEDAYRVIQELVPRERVSYIQMTRVGFKLDLDTFRNLLAANQRGLANQRRSRSNPAQLALPAPSTSANANADTTSNSSNNSERCAICYSLWTDEGMMRVCGERITTETCGHQFHRKCFHSIINAFYEARPRNRGLPKCPVCRGRLTEGSTAEARRQQDEVDRIERDRERRRDQRMQQYDQSSRSTQSAANQDNQSHRYVHDFRPPEALGTRRSTTTSRSNAAMRGFQSPPTALGTQRTAPQRPYSRASAATERLLSFRSTRYNEILRSMEEARAAADYNEVQRLTARLDSIFTEHPPPDWDQNTANYGSRRPAPQYGSNPSQYGSNRSDRTNDRTRNINSRRSYAATAANTTPRNNAQQAPAIRVATITNRNEEAKSNAYADLTAYQQHYGTGAEDKGYERVDIGAHDNRYQKIFRFTSERAKHFYTDYYGERETDRRLFGLGFETEDELRRTYNQRNQHFGRARARFPERWPANNNAERTIGSDGRISWRASWNPYVLKNCLTIIYNGAGIEIGYEDGRDNRDGLNYRGLRLYQFRSRNRVIGWIALQYPDEWGLANGRWTAVSQELQRLRSQRSSALTRTVSESTHASTDSIPQEQINNMSGRDNNNNNGNERMSNRRRNTETSEDRGSNNNRRNEQSGSNNNRRNEQSGSNNNRGNEQSGNNNRVNDNQGDNNRGIRRENQNSNAPEPTNADNTRAHASETPSTTTTAFSVINADEDPEYSTEENGQDDEEKADQATTGPFTTPR